MRQFLSSVFLSSHTVLILHVVWLQSSAALSKVSRIRPRSPPSGDTDACSASKIGLNNKHEHDLPNITWYCTLWNWQCLFCDRRWACIGLLSPAIILILSRLYGHLWRNVHRSIRAEVVLWSCKGEWCAGIDVTSVVFFFPSNKGCFVHVLEKPAAFRFGVLPRVLSLIYVLLHRSSIAPMRWARCWGKQATFQRSAEVIVTVWAG